MALMYIAGYVARHDNDVDDTMDCMEKYGEYLREINRGGLKLPGDTVSYWVFYSYIMFLHLKNSVCRVSLCNIMMIISDFYCLENIERKHGQILGNIFFNNYSNLFTPRSSKESKMKVIKLSDYKLLII